MKKKNQNQVFNNQSKRGGTYWKLVYSGIFFNALPLFVIGPFLFISGIDELLYLYDNKNIYLYQYGIGEYLPVYFKMMDNRSLYFMFIGSWVLGEFLILIAFTLFYCKPEDGDLTETREEIRRIFMYFCAVFLLISLILFSYRILF